MSIVERAMRRVLASQLIPIVEVVRGGHCDHLPSEARVKCEGCIVKPASMMITWTPLHLRSNIISHACLECIDCIRPALSSILDVRSFWQRAALSSLALLPRRCQGIRMWAVCICCGLRGPIYCATLPFDDRTVRFHFCGSCMYLFDGRARDIERGMRRKMIGKVIILATAEILPRDILGVVVQLYSVALVPYLEAVWSV